MAVTWQTQVTNAYAAKVAKLVQAAKDNPNLARSYLKTAKVLQETVDLYRSTTEWCDCEGQRVSKETCGHCGRQD